MKTIPIKVEHEIVVRLGFSVYTLELSEAGAKRLWEVAQNVTGVVETISVIHLGRLTSMKAVRVADNVELELFGFRCAVDAAMLFGKLKKALGKEWL